MQKKLEVVYERLYEDCATKLEKKNNTSMDLNLPSRGLIDGSQRFDILRILSSSDYRLQLESSLSKGFGIGVGEIEYDPSSLSFKILIGENGEILFRKSTASSIKEKMRIKKVAGIKLSDEEKDDLEKAHKHAHFMYFGTISVVDLNTPCKTFARGDLEESYCPKGLKTYWKRVKVVTGELVIQTTSEVIHPFFISDDLQGKTPDHTSRGNLSQINSTLRLIQSSVCHNRHEIYSLNSNEEIQNFKFMSGFTEELSCEKSVVFPMPAPISRY